MGGLICQRIYLHFERGFQEMSALTPGITVLIPTFRRTAELDRCLAAIDAQLLRPVEVWITYRPEDEETRAYLTRTDRHGLGAKLILCDKPGVVYALTKAMDAVRTEFFAITDDDSVPYPDWLVRIMVHFEANPEVAGVGGKDHVCAGGVWFEGAEPVVGRVLWYGGVIGHHHLGVGPPRYVGRKPGVSARGHCGSTARSAVARAGSAGGLGDAPDIEPDRSRAQADLRPCGAGGPLSREAYG
jgi:hypothetical protein